MVRRFAATLMAYWVDLFSPVIQKIEPAPSRIANAEMVPALPISFVLSFIRDVMSRSLLVLLFEVEDHAGDKLHGFAVVGLLVEFPALQSVLGRADQNGVAADGLHVIHSAVFRYESVEAHL